MIKPLNGPNATSGQAPKAPPKFIPKIPPIKKEKVSDGKSDVLKSNDQETKKPQRPSFNGSGGRGRGGRFGDGGRDNIGGRNKWVMPSGNAFFTANQSEVNIKAEPTAINADTKTSVNTEGASVKISRPNEDIFHSLHTAKVGLVCFIEVHL
jgi:hypothetical protein